jgi:S1-C subfamily serine protease
MTSEPSDLRIRLGDGREVEAHVVLRDKDLDLAFLRPVDALDKPVAALDGPSAKPGVMDAVVGLQRYGEMAGWQVAASLGYVQLTIDKPRLMYVVAAEGSAVFDMTGKFIGMLVTKHAKPTGGDSNPFALLAGGGAMEGIGMMTVVLPADDIRAVAKQATGK